MRCSVAEYTILLLFLVIIVGNLYITAVLHFIISLQKFAFLYKNISPHLFHSVFLRICKICNYHFSFLLLLSSFYSCTFPFSVLHVLPTPSVLPHANLHPQQLQVTGEVQGESTPQQGIDQSQLHQSRFGLVFQACMLMITVCFLFSDVLGGFWKNRCVMPGTIFNVHACVMILYCEE